MLTLLATDAAEVSAYSGYAFGAAVVGAVIAVVTMMRREARKDDSAAVRKWREIANAESNRVKVLEEYVKTLLARDLENTAKNAQLVERLSTRDETNAELRKRIAQLEMGGKS